MMKINLFSLLLMMGVLLASCEKEDDEPKDNGSSSGGDCSPEYSEGPASGAVFGTAFSDPEGLVNESFFDNEKYEFTFFLETENEGCDMSNAGDGYHISFDLPKEGLEGEYNLGGEEGYTVSFVQTGKTIAATCGTIEITSVSDTEVSGQIDVHYDGENNINGQFTLPLCE